MKSYIERGISLALVAAVACAMSACTYHRTVVERPVIAEPSGSAIIVPKDSEVTVRPDTSC